MRRFVVPLIVYLFAASTTATAVASVAMRAEEGIISHTTQEPEPLLGGDGKEKEDEDGGGATETDRTAQNSEDGDPSGENDDGGGNGSCTAYEVAKAGVVGAAVTMIAVPLIVLFGVGLSPCGPVAGGWFAANQGAAISAASTMAWLQSLAMGGNAVAAWIIGCVSAATGGGSGAYLMHLLGCSQE